MNRKGRTLTSHMRGGLENQGSATQHLDATMEA
jgi:hypothetical protein